MASKNNTKFKYTSFSPLVICYLFVRRWGGRRWCQTWPTLISNVLVKCLLHILSKFHETCSLLCLLFRRPFFEEESVRHFVVLQELVKHVRAMGKVASTHLHCHLHKLKNLLKQMIYHVMKTWVTSISCCFKLLIRSWVH